MKEVPLWIVHPPTSFASISYWGLKHIWKSAYLAQALLIGIFHCLAEPESVVKLHYKVATNNYDVAALWFTLVQGA